MKTSVGRSPEETRWGRIDIILAIAVIVGGLLGMFQLMVGGRGLDLEYVQENLLVYLSAGLFVNLYATTVSFAGGIVIGFFMGWLRSIRSPSLKRVLKQYGPGEEAVGSYSLLRLSVAVLGLGVRYYARRIGDAYVEIIRGTPLFVQMLFVSSVILVSFPEAAQFPIIAGVIALMANTGGYQAEIFRAGLSNVSTGQIEAARGLGLSRLRAMRYVILPQALRLIVPPLTNEYIGLFKASSLLFILGVYGEITFLANQNAFAGNVFEIFAMVAVIFLGFTAVLSFIVRRIEVKFRIPGLGIQHVRTERA